jgi:hypothetical protein
MDNTANVNNQIAMLLSDVHTAIPAIVQSYDSAKRTLKAQPGIKRKTVDGFVAYPLCVDVPVFFAGGGGFEITHPISNGDACLLVFAEKNIDDWFATGQVSNYDDRRFFSMSDGFAFVGFAPAGNKGTAQTDGLHVTGPGVDVHVGNNTCVINVGGTQFTVSPSQITASKPIYAPNFFVNNKDLLAHMTTHTHPYKDNGAKLVTGVPNAS